MSGLNEELPEGWEIADGDSLFEFVRGVSYKKEDASELAGKSTVAILRAGNLQAGEILLDDLVYVPKNYVRDEQRVQQGDLIIAMSSGSASVVGKVSVAMHDMPNVSFGTFCGLLRPRSTMLKHWLSEYFQTRSYRSFISDLAAGVNINNLRREHLLELQIPVPPKGEMQRVERKIEALQERSRRAREALAEVKSLLEQFRQSVLAAAFRGDLTADWREQNPDVEPASELLKRIRAERRKKWEASELAKYAAKGKTPPKGWQDKYVEPEPVDDSELPALPESWCWANVDELTELITSGSRAWSKYYDQGDGTFIMAQNVRPGHLDFAKGRQHVGPPEDDADRRRSQVCVGDLLVTIVGANTGDVCPVIAVLPNHWVCQSVALMRLVDPDMFRIILRYFLPGGGGRVRFDKVIYGQGRPHLGFDDLRRMPVPLPPLEEQAALIAAISVKEEAINLIEREVAEVDLPLTYLDQSILAKAFRGELVPQDPNDEPASVLLERIRQQREQAPVAGKRRKASTRK